MELDLVLDRRRALATGVYRALRDAMENDRLSQGDRLPSTRALARGLGIARNTVAAAYDALVAEGYAVGRVGSGTYVTGLAGRNRPPSSDAAAAAPGRPSASDPPAAPTLDLRLGLPDARLFPAAAWRRAMADAVDEAVCTAPGYGDPAGDAGLRASIARHVGVSRGVVASGEAVLVTAGAQGAFDLLASRLVAPGDRVVVEDPGYPPAREAFAARGGVVVGVPVDAEGLVTDALPGDARVAVLTPAHQMPMGVTMSAVRRAELVAWAERTGAVVVEDDYDSEFRFAARPLEPLQRLDRADRVVYVGSFSKTLLPMLRVGFLVAPGWLLADLREAIRLAGGHVAAPIQLALRRLIDDGTFGRHLRRARRSYRGRHDRLVAAVGRDLASWVQPNPAAAGLHVAALAVEGVEAAAILRAVRLAGEHGVAVEPLERYALGPDRRPAGIALGFGSIDEAAIEPAVRVLARAFAAR